MSSNGAWKKLGSHTVFHGYVSVNRDNYEEPNGNVTDWDVIDSGDTVATIAFTEEARYVVLFEQFRVGPNAVLRELPGGFIDRGELPMAAAARELSEETGYGSATGFYAGSEWWAANSPRRNTCAYLPMLGTMLHRSGTVPSTDASGYCPARN